MSEIKPVLPTGSLYGELASLTWRVVFTNGRREIKPLSHWSIVVGGVSGVSESSGARAAREFAPFPARALRDRPWDISALVE
jgi:hypothetical protein